MSPASLLAPIRGLVLDMDGVLWQGARALPGLNALFAIAEARGIELVLATNNSSRRPEDHAARLAGMGQRLPPERILTSSTVTAARLARDHAAGSPEAIRHAVFCHIRRPDRPVDRFRQQTGPRT